MVIALNFDESGAASATKNVERIASRAQQLERSPILQIADQIRQMQANGEAVCNLTVGDYSPKEFPMPAAFLEEVHKAIDAGATNYPPTTGVWELRDAVCEFYRDYFGLSYPRESVVITAGSRPVVHSFFSAVLEPGDLVLNPTPSWNIHYYSQLAGVTQIKLPSKAENGFLPTAADIEPHLQKIRILALCSPGNPTGTVFEKDELEKICQLVLQENERRKGVERPLYLLFDQVYWPMCHGGRKHHTPVQLCPELAPYTVFVDGVSKAFAGTGVRIGWGVGAPDIIGNMAKFTSHCGSWAPKPLQVATAKFLARKAEVKQALVDLQQKLEARLTMLSSGLKQLIDEKLPINFIDPQGALYISFQVQVVGRKARDGTPLDSNEAIRKYLLSEAGMGIVGFECFGVDNALTWFRLSVGGASDDDIQQLIPRLRAALEKIQ